MSGAYFLAIKLYIIFIKHYICLAQWSRLSSINFSLF